MTVPGLTLGAPGIYRIPARAAVALDPERLDVGGFVGVTPRGPVDVPVAVDSWSDYRWRFGGTAEGPGLLPHAVHAFFAQGGRRAYVLRVSPLPRWPDPAAVAARARHRLLLGVDTGARVVRPIDVQARDEGKWGNRLSIRWDFDADQQFTTRFGAGVLDVPDGVRLPDRSLLRLRGPGLPVGGLFAWTASPERRVDDVGLRRTVAPLIGGPVLAAGASYDVSVVTVAVTVTDLDPTMRREELHSGLGLRAGHPRFVRDVLAAESLLVAPVAGWPDALLPRDEFLTPVVSSPAPGGVAIDRWAGISRDSLFGDIDPGLLPIGGPDGLDDLGQVFGVDRMALEQEIGLLTVPDLFWAYADAGTVQVVDRPPPSAEVVDCVTDPQPLTLVTPVEEILLDGRTELEEILGRQQRVVAHADRQRRFVALLDVPQHLSVRQIARWRARFSSSYAAAYHPWLGVVRPGAGSGIVAVPPSAFAAGIIAERENRLGLTWGPANEPAYDAVLSLATVSDADHSTLHLLGVDVFRDERDGFRLTSARTLSRDPDYRQLSVRRLITMLRLVLERQLQGLVFEPNSPQLQRSVRDVVVQLLRQLYSNGAFTGASEDEAFFVRCDDTVNPSWSVEQGRLVAEIGVAPAQPLEYIVLRVSQDVAGGLSVEPDR